MTYYAPNQLVGFHCETCGEDFDLEGEVVRTDDEGGKDFIPGLGVEERVFCPNDDVLLFDPQARYTTHDVSLVG